MTLLSLDRELPPAPLDVAASAAAWLFPSLSRAIDQARLDATILLGGLRGRHPTPARSRRGGLSKPPALARVDVVAGALPGPLARRYRRGARDLGVLLGSLRGRRPPPVVARQVARRPVAGEASRLGAAATARRLRVAEVFDASATAKGFWLEDGAGRPIPFVPGQFLTLLVDLDGVVQRRAYSICSSAREALRVRLVAKRVPGGAVSSWLNDRLRPGDLLPVLGPSGSFTVSPEPGRRRHHVLIAGGSGITPLMAILIALSEDEPESRVTLLYGNRRREDVIFAAELDELCARSERLTVRHVLSEPPEGWAGGVGVLDERLLRAELERLGLPERGLPASYYLCGPLPMMAAARAALLDLGVEARSISEERFSAPQLRGAASQRRSAAPQPVTLQRQRETHHFVVAPGVSLLDAALAAGVPLRFSCAMGGCGECRLRLVEGEVALEEPNCLTAEERAAGVVLTCVGWPLSPVVLEAL